MENLPGEENISRSRKNRAPNKNPWRATSRYIIIKMSKIKDKERLLKAAREKQIVTYKGNPTRLSADF